MLYAPSSQSAIDLFRAAALKVGLPGEWSEDPGLHNILKRESGGWVGRPNYQFGDLSRLDHTDKWPQVWEAIRQDQWRDILVEPYRSGARGRQSSATGLGQLTVTNIDTGKFYPSKRAGIGIPEEEAIGMLRYIRDRYQTPGNAWKVYNLGHEGY